MGGLASSCKSSYAHKHKWAFFSIRPPLELLPVLGPWQLCLNIVVALPPKPPRLDTNGRCYYAILRDRPPHFFFRCLQLTNTCFPDCRQNVKRCWSTLCQHRMSATSSTWPSYTFDHNWDRRRSISWCDIPIKSLRHQSWSNSSKSLKRRMPSKKLSTRVKNDKFVTIKFERLRELKSQAWATNSIGIFELINIQFLSNYSISKRILQSVLIMNQLHALVIGSEQILRKDY